MKQVTLFCIPYAGGSSKVYSFWRNYLSPNIELKEVELPGRGSRFNEPLCSTIEELADDVYHTVKNYLSENTYAFFGHSMGGAIICELMKKVYKEEMKKPAHLFLSGAVPPHLDIDEEKTNSLDDEQFKNRVLKLEGTPLEVLRNKELIDIFMPILRADFGAADSYQYISSGKWDVDITLLNGKSDHDAKEIYLSEWNQYTTGKTGFYYFDGGHFYINDNYKGITKIINEVFC